MAGDNLEDRLAQKAREWLGGEAPLTDTVQRRLGERPFARGWRGYTAAFLIALAAVAGAVSIFRGGSRDSDPRAYSLEQAVKAEQYLFGWGGLGFEEKFLSGRKIAFFARNNAEEAFSLYVMKADGSSRVKIDKDCRGNPAVAVSPDGVLLAYRVQGDYILAGAKDSIRFINLETPSILYFQTIEGNRHIFSIAFCIDSNAIAYDRSGVWYKRAILDRLQLFSQHEEPLAAGDLPYFRLRDNVSPGGAFTLAVEGENPQVLYVAGRDGRKKELARFGQIVDPSW